MTLKTHLIWLISVSLSLFSSMATANDPNRMIACEYYADSAVGQQRRNIANGCGFSGSRWSTDFAGHQQWCSSVRRSITDKEEQVRKEMLDTCLEDKAIINHHDNHLPLPIACIDPRGEFFPVKHLYYWFRYERALYSPVQDGLIAYDFNRDGRHDYLFIERNKKDTAQLSFCFSANNYPARGGYERFLTDVNFYVQGNSLAGQKYIIKRQGDVLTVDIPYFAHNEGSCHTHAEYRFNPQTQVFDVINRNSECYPQMIPGSNDPYPISAFPEPTLRK